MGEHWEKKQRRMQRIRDWILCSLIAMCFLIVGALEQNDEERMTEALKARERAHEAQIIAQREKFAKMLDLDKIK